MRKSLEFVRMLRDALNSASQKESVFVNKKFDNGVLDKPSTTLMVGIALTNLCKANNRLLMLERSVPGGRVDYSVLDNRANDSVLVDIEHENSIKSRRSRSTGIMKGLEKSLNNLAASNAKHKVLITYISRKADSDDLFSKIQSFCKEHVLTLYLVWGRDDVEPLEYRSKRFAPDK